jgi:hypothetical protein
MPHLCFFAFRVVDVVTLEPKEGYAIIPADDTDSAQRLLFTAIEAGGMRFVEYLRTGFVDEEATARSIYAEDLAIARTLGYCLRLLPGGISGAQRN